MRNGYTRSLSTAAWLTTTVAALATASPASLSAQAKQQGAVMNVPAITAVRKALEKYKDPIAAVRDGYFSTVGCVDFPAGGTEHGAMEYKPGRHGRALPQHVEREPKARLDQTADPSLRAGG